jgi:competence protein ComEC
MDPRLNRIFNNAVLALLSLAVITVWLAVAARPQNLLQVIFCDVGQGDAVLIKTPQNKKVLIDGGPDDQVLNCLSRQLPFYERTLDLVVLTHPHADHVGGLVDVLNSFSVRAIVHNKIAYQSADYQKFLELASQHGIPLHNVFAGDRMALDSATSFSVWYPPRDARQLSGAGFDPFDGEDINDSSLVFELVCGDFTALFTGDSPDVVQNFLLGEGVVSPVRVLKVAHHGARDGLSSEFLKKLNPALAIISVGANNKYGHPHKETLEKLKDAGVQIKRTDLDGTVEVTSDCKEKQDSPVKMLN